MSDVNRLDALQEEDRLPWLETVEEDQPRGGAGAGTLVAALIAALVALGLVVGGIFWLRDRGEPSTDGEGELIAAPAGDYKEKPSSPGGMKVEGQGDATYQASTGKVPNAAIDVAALPEAPLKGAGAPKHEEQAAALPPKAPTVKTAVAVKPAETEKAAPPAAREAPVSGGTIQLGAFSSEARANAQWKSLSERFAYLKPYNGSVTPAANGKLYRIRVTAGQDAASICGKLKVAGETCAVVSN